jgi:hypothetical protein
LPTLWQTEPDFTPSLPSVNWQSKPLAGLTTMAIIKRQLRRISQDKQPQTNDSPLWSLLVDQFRTKKHTKRYRNTLGITHD